MEHRRGLGLEAWAEAVLDVPFRPDLYQDPTMQPPYRVVPVQHYAQEYLRQEFPDVCRQRSHPDDTSVREIREVLGDSDIALLREYVAMAHNMSEAASGLQCEQYDEPGLQARADYQYLTTKTILQNLQLLRVPGGVPRLPPISEALRTGVVVVAPCGFGKTWVGAQAMAGAGVGRRLHPDDSEPVRGLVVVPSIDRLQEYIEEDDRNIFRKVLGFDVPVGQYYGGEKDVQPVTVITEASLRNVVQRGGMPVQRLGMVLFDEIHRGTSPQNMDALQRISGAVAGLTASPAYNYLRDIRRYFPHVSVGSLREFTELGILNRARLLTYRAAKGAEGMEASAVDLAVQWLRQERRVVVYGPRGDSSREKHSVDRIAAEINRRMGAEVVGAARSALGQQAQDRVRDFRDGKLQGLVTVNMISIGSNVEADTLILCGPFYSEVNFMQKVGRAMRPTEKETILAELWPHKPPTRQMLTLAMLFGIEDYQQGMLIGRTKTPSALSLAPLSTPDAALGELSVLPPMSPEQIRSYLVGATQGEYYRPPPEGYLDDVAVMRRYHSTQEYIRQTLDKAGITYTSLPARTGVRRQHWYGPPALAYLDEHPPMEVCGDTFKPFREVAELLNIPGWLVADLCDTHDIPREDKLIEQLAQEKCLPDASIHQLMNVLYELPYADSGKHVNAAEISPLVGGESFVREFLRCAGVSLQLMRYDQGDGRESFGFFLTIEESDTLVEWHQNRNKRGGLQPLKSVAQRSGNTVAYIQTKLTQSERDAVVYRLAGGKGPRTLLPFVPDLKAEAIIAREMLPALGVGMIARKALEQLFDAPARRVQSDVEKHITPEGMFTGRVQYNRVPTAYVSWAAVDVVADDLPRAAAFQNLDIGSLSADYADGLKPEEVLYTRLAQAVLMSWHTQDTWHAIDEAALAMRCQRHVIDAFNTTRAFERQSLWQQDRSGVQLMHFKALAQIFSSVVAAPVLRETQGWRSHSQLIARAASNGIAAEHVRIPVFSVRREDMVIGRLSSRSHNVDVIYETNLANRLLRGAKVHMQEAETAACRAQRNNLH